MEDRRTSSRRTSSTPIKPQSDGETARSKPRRKHLNRLQVFANNHGVAVLKINSKNAFKVLLKISTISDVKVVSQTEDSLTVAFKSKHLSQVIAILSKLCYNYQIIKIMGIVPACAQFVSRLGIILGTVLAVLILVFSTSFVTRVSISGCEDAALRLQIAETLKASGVKSGTEIAKIDRSALEKSLLSLDGIAFASVTINGGHLLVVVKEELAAPEFEEIAGGGVTAKKRAVVTRVIVNGGTAVVNYGDVVNAGDVLIDGYTLYGEDKIPVQADGEVWGKVYYQKKTYFANTTLVKSYGRTKTVTRLSLFGIVPKMPKCKFEAYELETRVSKNGFLIPYLAYTYVFRELKTAEVQGETDETALKQKAYSALIQEIDGAVKILNVYYLVESGADGKYVTVTVEAEEKIT